MSAKPRIATVGLASWDTFIVIGTYPVAGSFAMVRNMFDAPGGTTTNSAIALAKLGARVSFAGMVGDDDFGVQLRTALDDAGVDTAWLETRKDEPTDRSIVIVSDEPQDRTILWPAGAHLVKGDLLDVPGIFGNQVVLLDIDDMPLRRFLTDLPVHTLPATRLLGTLVYMSDTSIEDRLEIMLRHDAIIGNERELLAVVGSETLDAAIARVQHLMVGSNLRVAIVSRGADGAIAFTPREQWSIAAHDVSVIDTTGAGDAFAAGIAYGMSLRWDWPKTLMLANAMGGLTVQSLGGQTADITWERVAELTNTSLSDWVS